MKNILLIGYFIFGSFGFCFSQGEQLFDDSYLHEIRFNEVDTLMLNGNKIYQMVNMIFDGVSVDSVGLKDKGNISFSYTKPPLKIKTNKYTGGKKYDGIKEFTLHNSAFDPTLMREKLTYEICR